MLDAFSAELMKFRRHRAAWSLLWILPIGVAILSAIGIAMELARGTAPDPSSATAWVDGAAAFWGAPGNGVIRYLLAAFTGVVFAGEYGWNTWKLIVPHQSRVALIAAKFVAVLALVYAAFWAAALLMTGFKWLEDVLTGAAIPAGISLPALAQAHWQGFLASLPPVLLTVAITALASVLTGSMTAAIVIGIIVTTLEELFRTFGPLLSHALPSGLVETLYQVLPGHHVANVASWARHGGPVELRVPFASGNMMEWGWAPSLAVVAAWVIGLAALTFYRFRRQDLN